MEKKKVLFVCSYNSVRSQMAEGLLKNMYPYRYKVCSAGIQSSGINPHAVKVMDELGIDISNQRSKGINEFLNKEFDYVVTVCDKAEDICPFFPGGGVHIHKNFTDPAKADGNEQGILNEFRKIRDEIKNWIKKTF